MITPEALAISPGTVTNVDVEPFFVEDWWSGWRDDKEDKGCKWNWEDDYKEGDWETRYNKVRLDAILNSLNIFESFVVTIKQLLAEYLDQEPTAFLAEREGVQQGQVSV